MHIEHGDDEAGLTFLAAHARCGLDVFRGCLGLAEDRHQAEPRNIETDRNHVRRERDIQAIRFGQKGLGQAIFRFGNRGG